MPNDDLAPKSTATTKPPTWLVVVLILIGIGFTLWRNNNDASKFDLQAVKQVFSEKNADFSTRQDNRPDEDEPSVPEIAAESERNSLPVGHHNSHPEHAASSSEKSDEASFKIEHQSIRDLNGKVVYTGTIDLKATLDRIKRGEANRHHNDGTAFQNREGRLPRKPSGYYKEYVHPTPGINGPGPQRVIMGRDGDVWYTPDHYKTFKQITLKKT